MSCFHSPATSLSTSTSQPALDADLVDSIFFCLVSTFFFSESTESRDSSAYVSVTLSSIPLDPLSCLIKRSRNATYRSRCAFRLSMLPCRTALACVLVANDRDKRSSPFFRSLLRLSTRSRQSPPNLFRPLHIECTLALRLLGNSTWAFLHLLFLAPRQFYLRPHSLPVIGLTTSLQG